MTTGGSRLQEHPDPPGDRAVGSHSSHANCRPSSRAPGSRLPSADAGPTPWSGTAVIARSGPGEVEGRACAEEHPRVWSSATIGRAVCSQEPRVRAGNRARRRQASDRVIADTQARVNRRYGDSPLPAFVICRGRQRRVRGFIGEEARTRRTSRGSPTWRRSTPSRSPARLEARRVARGAR